MSTISAPTGFFNGSAGNSQPAQDLQGAIVSAEGLLATAASTIAAANAAAAAASQAALRAGANVTQRSPTASDDSTRGYAVGNLWTAPSGLYRATRVSPGAAMWSPAPTPALPLDAVTGSAVCAYGTRRLRAAYTGPCMDVLRASDSTTLTISFLSSGAMDHAALDAFLAGTTGTISTLYDQTGNGWHATQTTVAQQPAISPFGTIGNARSVQFNVNLNGNSPTAVSLNIPAGATLNGNAQTIVALGKFVNISKDSTLIGLNNATVPSELRLNNTSRLVSTYGGLRSMGMFPSNSPIVMGFTNSTTVGWRAWANEVVGSSGAWISSSNVMAGGTLGGRPTVASSGFCEIAAAVVYGRGVTQAEQDTLNASLGQMFGIVRQVRNTVQCVGDSITLGQSSSNYRTYPRRLQSLLPQPTNVFSFANLGWVVEQLTPNTSFINPPYDPTATNNILLLFAGTNNIVGGQSGATTWGKITTFLSAYNPVGWQILVGTMLPRASVATERANLNDLIRSGWKAAGAAGIVDFAADPTMGPDAASADTTLFSDGIHPTDLGYDYLAQIAASAVNAVMV